MQVYISYWTFWLAAAALASVIRPALLVNMAVLLLLVARDDTEGEGRQRHGLGGTTSLPFPWAAEI